METLNQIFSHLCGQNTRVVINNVELPLCLRCFGLYSGAAVTAIWILFTKPFRRGLPDLTVFSLHLVMLLTAMLSGLHIINPNPQWALMCGFWTGHVIVAWLTAAAAELSFRTNPIRLKKLTWKTRDHISFFACVASITILSQLFAQLHFLGPAFWTTFATAAALSLLIFTVATLALTAFFIFTAK